MSLGPADYYYQIENGLINLLKESTTLQKLQPIQYACYQLFQASFSFDIRFQQMSTENEAPQDTILDVQSYFKSLISKIEQYYIRRLQKLSYFIEKSLQLQNNHKILKMVRLRLQKYKQKQPWRLDQHLYFKQKQKNDVLLNDSKNQNQLLNFKVQEDLIEIYSGTSTPFSRYSDKPSFEFNNDLDQAIYFEDNSVGSFSIDKSKSNLKVDLDQNISLSQITKEIQLFFQPPSPKTISKCEPTIKDLGEHDQDSDDLNLSDLKSYLMNGDTQQEQSKESIIKIFTWEENENKSKQTQKANLRIDSTQNLKEIFTEIELEFEQNKMNIQEPETEDQNILKINERQNIFQAFENIAKTGRKNEPSPQGQSEHSAPILEDHDSDKITNEILLYLKKHRKSQEASRNYFQRKQRTHQRLDTSEQQDYSVSLKPNVVSVSPYSNNYQINRYRVKSSFERILQSAGKPPKQVMKNNVSCDNLTENQQRRRNLNLKFPNENRKGTPDKKPPTKVIKLKPLTQDTNYYQNSIYKFYQDNLKQKPEKKSQRDYQKHKPIPLSQIHSVERNPPKSYHSLKKNGNQSFESLSLQQLFLVKKKKQFSLNQQNLFFSQNEKRIQKGI